MLLTLEYAFKIKLPEIASFIINAIAYLLAGRKVLDLAFRKSKRGDIFNEFVLMSVATIGAFIIGEYEEGVAVMVFYQIGEWFQDAAVNNAKRSIKALLDIRPDEVTVIRNNAPLIADPSIVELNETIQVKPGEKVALDGELLSENASFNTAALTGESKPDTKYKGDAWPSLKTMNRLAPASTTSQVAARMIQGCGSPLDHATSAPRASSPATSKKKPVDFLTLSVYARRAVLR